MLHIALLKKAIRERGIEWSLTVTVFRKPLKFDFRINFFLPMQQLDVHVLDVENQQYIVQSWLH